MVGRQARQQPGRGPGGVGWRQGCFTPLRQSPVGRGFNHGALRDCREVHAGGGSQHFYRRRIVACWHMVTCHHAARGRSTLLNPGLRGLLTGPTPPSPPAHSATSLGGVGGNWKMEDTVGGLVRALPTLQPPPRGSFSRLQALRLQRVAAAAAAPAVGGGRAGR